MGKKRIELQGISKSYYSETSVTQALRKIDLSFYEGEFVAITGESGSGKSTLLNIIGGMDGFDEGEMYIDGLPTFPFDEQDWEDYRRNRIGYVFQDYSLIGHYSVLYNVMSALLVMGKGQEESKEIAARYLDKVGLKGYETHRASELSSGQKQRLSIARALAKQTGILVADEPTANLDSETGGQIIRLLKELSQDTLVIMVTHNFSQAEPYVTRKIRIHDGMLISDVAVHEGISEASEEASSLSDDAGQRRGDVTLELSEESAAKAGEAVESKQKESGTGTGEEAENEPKEAADAKNKIAAEAAAVKADRKKEFLWQNQLAARFARMNRKTQRGRAFMFIMFLFVISTISFLFFGELYLHKDDIDTKIYAQKAFYQQNPNRIVISHKDGSVLTEEELEELRKLAYVRQVDSCDLASDINFYMEQNRDYRFVYGKSSPNSMGENKQVKFLNEDHFMRSADCITEKDLAAGSLPQSRNEVVIYGEEDQIGKKINFYFSANNLWGPNEYYLTVLTVSGVLKEETEQAYFSRELGQMFAICSEPDLYRIIYFYDVRIGDYTYKPWLIPVISDDLSEGVIRVASSWDVTQQAPNSGEIIFRYEDFENGKLIESEEETVLNLSENHKSSGIFLEVSESVFYRHYTPKTLQASVYIVSYAKTDSVIRKLEKLGYQAVSTYRVSTTDYDPVKANERLVIIGICAAGLLMLLMVGILILRALMKIRLKDYFVLKFIGAKMQVIRKINYYEICGYCVTAMLMTVVIMCILWIAKVPVIWEMMWYYTSAAYLLFVLYNLLLSCLTVLAFNHLLKGRLNA